MPVNPKIEYKLAEIEYSAAKTTFEKIKTLEKMLSLAPSHKGAEKLRQEIKTKLSKLRRQIEKDRKRKIGGKRGFSIKKEGAAQVVLVGLTNSGKSTLLAMLTNAKPEIASYEFTTKMPEIGVIDYNGIKIQLIEIPAVFPGFADKGRGPAWLGIIKNSDLVIVVLDGESDCKQDFELIKDEFDNGFVRLGFDKKCFIVVNRGLKKFNCRLKVCDADDPENLKNEIWKELGLIYVYTKTPGKEKDLPPVAFKKGACVRDLASMVHKDFVKKFKFARCWGKSVRHDGSTVGLDHILEEGDVVELHLK